MTFPNKFIDAETLAIDSVFYNDFDSFKGRAQVDGGDNAHVWNIEFLTTPLTPEGLRELSAYITSLQGRLKTTTITGLLPWLSDDSAFQTSTASNVGTETVNVSNVSGEIKAGDYINFAGHQKAYLITTGTTGNGTIGITPPLKENVLSFTQITPATFTVRSSSDTHTMELDANSYQKKKVISFVEVI